MDDVILKIVFISSLFPFLIGISALLRTLRKDDRQFESLLISSLLIALFVLIIGLLSNKYITQIFILNGLMLIFLSVTALLSISENVKYFFLLGWISILICYFLVCILFFFEVFIDI